MALIAAITEALGTVITWIGTVITAVVGEAGAMNELLPVFAVGVGISIVFMVVKVVRSFTWGA